MFPSGNIIIKNEPIKTEEIELVSDKIFLQNVVIKCERDYYSNSSDLINFNKHGKSKTTICSESEYLAEGNVPFESIIVKEETRINACDDLTNTSDVEKYLWTEKLATNLECYLCRHEPGSVVDLRRHIKTHVVEELDGTFLSEPNKPKLSNEKCFACDQCDRKYAGQSGLYRHKVIHKGEKLFTCDQCHRKFLRKSTLKQHKLLHSGIKPFACDECDRKFSDSSTLYKHKQTHSGERPFGCNLCDRRCSRKSTLIRHLKTHTGEKSFVCNVCDKRFSRNSTLNHHKLIHTGENPFACDQCDRKFKIKSTLAYHLQTHRGEKPFGCDECGRNFLTKANLNQHKKTHSVEKQFCCDQCPKAYSDRTTLHRHKAIHHKPRNVVDNVVKSRTNKKKSKYTILMNKCKSLRKI